MSKINKIKIKDVSYDIEDLSIGDLNELETIDKSNLVNAINEVLSNAGGSGINKITQSINLFSGDATGFYQYTGTSSVGVRVGIGAGDTIGLLPNEIALYINVSSTNRYLIKPTVTITGLKIEGLYCSSSTNKNVKYFNMAQELFLDRMTEQTIISLKTFNTLPQSSKTPTNDNQLVNKKYVDDKFASSSGGSSNETYSTTETPIGTYINGETVYRKVVVGNLDGTWVENSKTFSWVDLGVKVDKVLRLNVCFDRDTEYKFTEASNVDLVVSVRSRPDYDTSDVQIGLKTSYSIGQEIHIIIEYTKATE